MLMTASELITQIFSVLSTIAQRFAGLLVDLFSAVVSIFYTEGSGQDPGSLTIIGVLALISLGTGLVIWAFNYIKRLITSARNKA